MKLKPEILTHPNIPKPLHGINPRTIMGTSWWNQMRELAYASTDYHCSACGIHKQNAKGHRWLEAHEFWHIDYEQGICTISSIEPLCHYCHNFIHSGRLKSLCDKDIPGWKVDAILEHGLEILSINGLKCFHGTLDFAKERMCNTFGVEAYGIMDNNIKWNDWILRWRGVDYHSEFENETAWMEFYANR